MLPKAGVTGVPVLERSVVRCSV